MSEEKSGFIGYEYRSITVAREMESIYVDAYENFGWTREQTAQPFIDNGTVTMKLKRDRKIRNKAELTRLQRQFDACAEEIVVLERSKSSRASILACTIGLISCAFLGGATFAYLGGMLPLMVILAIPGFLGWILPYFCYQQTLIKRTVQVTPFIERKHDEIYEVCEKASQLLGI